MSNKKIALAYPPGLFFSLSLSSRAMSFDPMLKPIVEAIRTSQSLWNRARSFDPTDRHYQLYQDVSIPLEQGRVFRPFYGDITEGRIMFQSLWNRARSFDNLGELRAVTSKVSIPL